MIQILKSHFTNSPQTKTYWRERGTNITSKSW